MLQIKKKFKLLRVYYCLQFVLKNKVWSNSYRLKKKQSTSITLRSPKHFNIGKHKIINLNYKLAPQNLKLSTYLYFSNFIGTTGSLYKLLQKRIDKSLGFSNKSIKLVVETKFKIMWLES